MNTEETHVLLQEMVPSLYTRTYLLPSPCWASASIASHHRVLPWHSPPFSTAASRRHSSQQCSPCERSGTPESCASPAASLLSCSLSHLLSKDRACQGARSSPNQMRVICARRLVSGLRRLRRKIGPFARNCIATHQTSSVEAVGGSERSDARKRLAVHEAAPFSHHGLVV